MDLAEIRSRIKFGQPVHLPPPSPSETRAEKDARTIPAEWIHELVDHSHNCLSVTVDIQNAIIGGDLALSRVRIEHALAITNSSLGTADFSFATFEDNLKLDRSEFKFLDCSGARMHHHA